MTPAGPSDSLVTEDMVEKALRITQPGLLTDIALAPAVKAARANMRAALEAVAGDIIEESGASGRRRVGGRRIYHS